MINYITLKLLQILIRRSKKKQLTESNSIVRRAYDNKIETLERATIFLH